MTHRLNAIRALRRRQVPPLHQRELAALIGCTQSDLSAYEDGRVVPTLRRAVRIARALGVPVEEVFFGAVAEAPPRMCVRRSHLDGHA